LKREDEVDGVAQRDPRSGRRAVSREDEVDGVAQRVSATTESAGPEGQVYRVYAYRWVVLGAVMFVNFAIQVLWIGFAPITSKATAYYRVSDLKIGILAMSFMLVFVPVSLPAAWVIDTKGVRKAVGFGSVLMALCGLARGLAGANYALALLFTIGIAIAQPFLLNAWTKVPATWFAPRERATAVGLTTLASMLGIAAGMALSPMLSDSMTIGKMQLLYGGLATAAAATFLMLARERPATSPSPPGTEERALMLDGLKSAVRVKPFLVILAVAFVVMGVFNGVTTWVEEIIKPRGFTSGDAGALGAITLVAGVVGAVVLPAISDKQGKRIRFLVLALALAVPGVVGLAFAASAWLLYLSAFVLGFFVVAILPIGMQYAAEVTFPTPEGTSNGLVQLCGQTSVAFVYIMSALKSGNGSYTPSLMLAVGLLVISAVAIGRLKDPRLGGTPSRMAGSGAVEAGKTEALKSGDQLG
jgi:MFS family permease